MCPHAHIRIHIRRLADLSVFDVRQHKQHQGSFPFILQDYRNAHFRQYDIIQDAAM